MRGEWFLAAVCFLASTELAFGDNRLDRKEINPRDLDEAFSNGDDVEADDEKAKFERGKKTIDLSNVSSFINMFFLLLHLVNIFGRVQLMFVQSTYLDNIIRNFCRYKRSLEVSKC